MTRISSLPGWAYDKVTINKGQSKDFLAGVTVSNPDIMKTGDLTKFVLELKTTGEINIFSDRDLYRPLISAFDPQPIDVQYISLSNFYDKVDFYFDCRPLAS